MTENHTLTRARTWSTALTRTIDTEHHRLAYRDLGPDHGTPLLLLAHLAATLDEWDPRLIDALAEERRVIAVDLPGVGGSTGQVPSTVTEMARSAELFLDALGCERVDVFGFSLGGFIAQELALSFPQRVRRLVLAGTGPAGGAGIDHKSGGAYIYWDMARAAIARTDAKEFLFFPRNQAGKAAAQDYLYRLRERVMDRDRPITVTSFRRQIAAIGRWGRARPRDLSGIVAPTLIANGDRDRMVPTALSRDMHERIPGSTLRIYPNSGHGGVFQHGVEFIKDVRTHLDA